MIEVPQQKPVAIYTYSLKEAGLVDEQDVIKESIGMRKLTLDEEMKAIQSSAGSNVKAAYLSARMSLVEVDGRVLDKTVGEDESVITRTDQQVRELILSAYADISSVSEVTSKKFLASRKVKVG